jgi:hypothetical protein
VLKPVTVSVTVPNGREEVFAFLDVLANHEPFTDHMMVDWEYSGPPSGVGARARMRLKRPGPADWMDMEVIASNPPLSTTEGTVGAGGKRRTRGTYVLEDLPGSGTRISFRFEWLEAPLSERLIAPVTRLILRRGNRRALQRLAERLGRDPPTPTS